MATLAQLRNSVYSKLGMDSTAAGNDEALVTGWLNEGVREVLLRTHCRVDCADMTLTSGSWKYDLPSSVLALKYVVDDESNPCEIIQFEDLLDLRRASATGQASRMRVALLGSNLFAVWPTPATAEVLDVFYVPKPTEMSTGTNDPSAATYGGVPSEFHKAIELWALAQGSDHEHEGRTQQGVNYLAQFDEYVRKFVRPAVNRMGGKRGQARIGRRPLLTSRNDTYPRY